MTNAKCIHYYAANQIGPRRCTITGRYDSMAEARAAVERPDESRCFAAASADDDSDLAVGMRVYHRDGVLWAAGPGSPNEVPGRNW